MRICSITEYFYPDATGGTPAVLSELTRYLLDTYLDLHIDVITSCNSYRSAKVRCERFQEWNGINIYRVKCPRSNRPSTALRLLTGVLFPVAGLDYTKEKIWGTNPPSAPVEA